MGDIVRKHIFKVEDSFLMFDPSNLRIYTFPKKYNKYIDELSESKIADLEENIKVPNNKKEKLTIKENNMNRCEKLALIISGACNLNCKYCYAQGGDYGKDSNCNNMTIETLKDAVKNTLKIFPEGIDSIQFFGGEPLLNIELVEQGIVWANEYFESKNVKRPTYTIVTNGTLINEKVRDIFVKYIDSVTISLDGNKYLNDVNRVYKHGNNSVHDVVIKNIDFLNENRNYYLNIEMTIDYNHINYYMEKNSIENFKYISNLKADSVHMLPVIDCGEEKKAFKNIDISVIKEYFDACTKESLRNGAKGINLVKVKSIIEILKTKRITDGHCSAGITTLSVDVNGDIYPCFMFNGNKKFFMGNIYKLDLHKFNLLRKEYLDKKSDKPDKCKACWVNTICTEACSGCIGSFNFANKDINKPVEIQCEKVRKC